MASISVTSRVEHLVQVEAFLGGVVELDDGVAGLDDGVAELDDGVAELDDRAGTEVIVVGGGGLGGKLDGRCSV